MTPLRFARIATLTVVSLTTTVGAQVSRSLGVTGEDGVTRTFTMAELSAMPQLEAVSEESDGTKIVYRGPSVRQLMTLVGAPTGRGLRGPAMMLAVLAEARDGYRVAYMLSEIDDQFGARKAIVALSADGKPMPDTEGPLRVVMAGEQHRARWIRQLTSLRLVRVTGR